MKEGFLLWESINQLVLIHPAFYMLRIVFLYKLQMLVHFFKFARVVLYEGIVVKILSHVNFFWGSVAMSATV